MSEKPKEQISASLSGSEDSESYSYSDDEKDKLEDAKELFQTSSRKLMRIGQSSSDSEGIEDDMSTSTRKIKTKRDNFVVDDVTGKALETQTITMSVAPNATINLNSEQIEDAARLFAEPTAVQPTAQPKVPKALLEILEAPKHSEILDFERDCDRGIDDTIKEEDLKKEAKWIARKYSGREDMQSLEETQSLPLEISIQKILRQLHYKKRTPQYIINYKKQIYSGTILGDIDIYGIQKAIKEFKSFRSKKEKIKPLKEYLKEVLRGNKETTSHNEKSAAEGLLTFIKEANESDLDNLLRYYQLQINEKTTQNNSIYKQNQKLFQRIVFQFLYQPHDFAYNLKSDDTNNAPPEPSLPFSTDPDQNTQEAILDEFYRQFSWMIHHPNQDPELIPRPDEPPGFDDFQSTFIVPPLDLMINQMISYAAETFATHPLIIQQIRQIFGVIVINTTPTKKGMKNSLLDPKGKYGSVKRLRKKPILSFKSTDQWLLIEEARKCGYISCDIDTSKGLDRDIETIAMKFRNQFGSDWNSFRTDIITTAIRKFIWPQIISETEKELLKNASQFVCDEIEERLFAQLTSPPYTVKSESEPHILKTTPILGIHYSEEIRNTVYMAMVNEAGSLVAHKSVDSRIITSRVEVQWESYKEQIRNPQLTQNDISGIKSKVAFFEFVNDHKPPVIAVTASYLRSASLVESISKLIDNRIPEYYPVIIFVPCDAANLYAHSKDCCDEECRELSKDGEFDPSFLIAASSARRIQNPLSELTRLVTPKRNHLADWSMTPFQSRFIGTSDYIGPVHEAVERACLRAVALTGVDMPSVLKYYHHQSVLQFVPGFGPKIANEIIKQARNSSKATRKDFIGTNILQENKFISDNAMPFIRFPADSKTEDQCIYDGTLIPMKFYSIADDFIKRGINEVNVYAEVNRKEFFSNQINRPKQYLSESINRYCSLNQSKPKALMEFIAEQFVQGPFERLRYPAVEWDDPDITTNEFTIKRFHADRHKIRMNSEYNKYRPMSDKELFDSFTISSPEPIIQNSITSVTIKKATESVILAEHSSSIKAVCEDSQQISYLLGELNLSKPDELKRTTHKCIIKEIRTALLEIVVSFAPKDLKVATEYTQIHEEDPYFDIDGENLAAAEEEENSKNKVIQYSRRAIQHKDFRDITLPQAEAELSNKEVGSAIFRPSSKGNDHLSLTIRFPNNVFANYDIVERAKRNPEALGDELFIRDKQFSDLEEIKWDFIKGIADNLKKITSNPKWIEDPEECEETIKELKIRSPNMLIYRVTTHMQSPGYLNLMWQANDKIVQEPLRLAGDLIYFRDVEYQDIGSIFNYLKTVGARTPPKTHNRKIFQQRTENEAKEDSKHSQMEKEKANSYGRNY